MKVGVSIMDTISSDIYEYRSPVFKVNSNVKESLLQTFYEYRNRWMKQSLLIAQCLMNVMKSDPNDTMYRYLKNMEPPTY